MKIILTLILAFLSTCGYSQIKIHGYVLDIEDKVGIDAVNIMLHNTTLAKIYTFTTSKNDGSYTLTYDGKADTLKIAVMGVHVIPQVITILPMSQRLDIFLDAKVLKIKEVIVKAQPIRRQSDTLKYNVGSFISVKDRSIEDVLKKLPGIDIEDTGKISYNGKAISKFYVEGLDMLGGRYSMASKNIQAKDVGGVEVYENHQSIKALQDIVIPEAAALNIKLKDSAKGVWTGGALVGLGYKPFMWNGELSAMYFGKKFQSLNTYKTNNTGDNVARELNSYYDGMGTFSSMLGVQLPTAPPLDENRYMNNNIHMLTTNIITKISDDVTFKANVSYAHDYQTSDGQSVTTHFISGATPIIIEEFTHAAQQSDDVNVDLDYTSNKDKAYLNNVLKFKGAWDKDFGKVLSNKELVLQDFNVPRIAVANDFQIIVPIKNSSSWSFKSNTNYTMQPMELRITPMIYPEIFGSPVDYPNAQQELNSKRFLTKNTAYYRLKLGAWNFFVYAGASAHIEKLDTQLSPMNNIGAVKSAVDSMQNDILWSKFDIEVGPAVSYSLGNALNINARANIDFMSLRIEDRIRNVKQDINKVILNPSLSVNGAITYDLKYSAMASYNEYYGGLYDSYGGFIMTDYRSISSKKGDISNSKMQNYGASIDYGNALKMLFGGVDANYWRSNRNLTYGTTYVGSLSYIESYATPTMSHGYGVNARISKHITGISTMLNLSGGFSHSWNEIIRQGDMLDADTDFIRAKFGFNTRFSNTVTMDYDCEYIRSMSNIEGIGKMPPIDHIVQKVELLFNFQRGFTSSISGSHYYNGTISSDDRNMFFLDAEISYKSKKFEYILEARNMLNTGVFNSASTIDITNYVYSYNLRPVSVMFKVRFNF